MAILSLHDNDGRDHATSQLLGFTAGLMDHLRISKSKISKWTELEKAKADQVAESYKTKLVKEQSLIDALATDLLSIQLERGLNVENQNHNESSSSSTEEEYDENIVTKTKELKDEMATLKVEVSKLEHEYENREKRLSDIALEECKQRTRAEEARALKERVDEARQLTVDDLTRGIVNYNYLGIDFEKTGVENQLRWCFSLLDPNDPDRQFSFVLLVVDDGDEKFEIAECEPPINPEILQEIKQRLNETDDMSYLARSMRHAFVETLNR